MTDSRTNQTIDNANGGPRVAIVASRFNEAVVEGLILGATEALSREGMSPGQWDVIRVPGAFEIPVVAKRLAESGRYNALICLGAVIRGATPHFEYVAGEAAKGIAATAMQSGVPVLFGVLTTETIEQAIERAGTKFGNKGWDAALGAIEMADLMNQLRRLE